MSQYIINGGKKLSGEIKIVGAKNAALKIIAASLLSKDKCIIKNAPNIEDVSRLIEILKDIGAKVNFSKSTITIDPSGINSSNPNPELIERLRSSIMIAGPLLARFGEVTLTHPGGCIIGKRPIDLFLSGFKQMGAEIKENKNNYIIKAKKLKGAKIVLPKVAVTVTESLMMTACLAEGTTTLFNAAMEPEIPALAQYLNEQGAKISGAGTSVITIEGVKELSGGEFNLIPDRIETGTFVMIGLITNSKIKITNCNPQNLQTELHVLKQAGANLEIGEDYIITKPSKLKGTDITTHEYPGFATDLQAPFSVLMTQAEGQSLIFETIFNGRLFYTDKLVQMGADIIMCDPHRVVINGPSPLAGRTIESPDLRAGMALVLAGIVAKGQTTIDNVYQIERGYENIVARLSSLGVDIKKI
jgi:UDP-N-acetylglucosamine 1-carboxyvinyltransferase